MKFPTHRKHNILKGLICFFFTILYYLNILNFENIIICCYNIKSRTRFYKNKNKNTKRCVNLFIDNARNGLSSWRKRNILNLINHKNEKTFNKLNYFINNGLIQGQPSIPNSWQPKPWKYNHNFKTKLNFFNKNKEYYNKYIKNALPNKYFKKNYFFTFKRDTKLNSQNDHPQLSKPNKTLNDVPEFVNKNTEGPFPNPILISLSEVFDFSLFYGTGMNRKYYKYGDIIEYVENDIGGTRFIENININNNLNKNYDQLKDNEETYFDDKPILVRGRIERKDKQSQRIILYLRQNSGLYIICAYEKKKNINENGQAEQDEMYAYIKNLKNETVVDIIGNIKINKKLYKHKIPHIESIYNQKRLEIQIRNIYKIAESYYVPPILPNDVPFLRTSILGNDQTSFKTDPLYEHTEEEEDKRKDVYNDVDKQTEGTIPPSLLDGNTSDCLINDDHQLDSQNVRGTNEGTNKGSDKNEIEYSESDYFCLNYRNSINQLIFNLKNLIIKKMRYMLGEDKYIEVFTPKLVRIDKPPKNKNNLSTQADNVNLFEKKEINKIKDNDGNTSMEKYTELNGSEGGSNCFKIENENIILAQSPQFYKQMIINYDYEKIFEINYSYRNEKFHSTKHLNEFLSLDIEQVIYNNYYEVVIYIYNFLKNIINYINTNFNQEINLINLSYGKKNTHTKYEPTMVTTTPVVLSFCEAHDILKKYYYVKNGTPFCSCKKSIQDGYIHDDQYNMCVKILNENEKNKLKKNIIFEDGDQNGQLHNVYYNNKIANNYKIDINNCENNYAGNINQDLSSQSVYSFLNMVDKNEIYNDILQFYNNIYDETMSTSKAEENKNFNQPTPSFFSNHTQFDKTCDMKTCQCMAANNENLFDIDKNSFNDNPNGYSHFSGISKYLEKNKNIKISVKEKNEIKKLKELYIYEKDFTNDELNYLYLFIKYNFNTDIFIIDQYPLHLRPFYSLSNLYDLRFTNSFDFIYKGTEIISGSQRINNLPLLLLRILKESINDNKDDGNRIDVSSYLQINKTNFNLSNYLDDLQKLINKNSTLYKYINSFTYSSKPHAGMALGLDRFFMLLFNLTNIKKTTYS
ncbi:aspartate--tRNA ligase, putative [Plasmodium chabaudi adami]|uniref:Aspartate--tRNA ligase, putative n=1 Tax=Plasmodium chabaudi adami TaxID=5826 RepID=A0A1C6YG72_PLACE|nr:aspartate--tRNA ligase, putative [Plasmodium chabaudi adami]